MNQIELSETTMERDLSVIFSSDLKWKQQVIAVSSKTSSILGMIRNTFVHFDKRLVRTLFTVYIRPLLEFAVTVWSPYLKGDINLLEKIQHRVTRMVPTLKRFKYERRLEILGITTLEERRRRGDLIQMFKIYNRIEEMSLCKWPEFKSESATRGHQQKYLREICSIEARQNFLTNRVANAWNELDNVAIGSKSTNEFKINIDKAKE
jgi:hypothetical protein